jgi:hypothetical protein
MSIQTTNYEPKFWTPDVWGESLRFKYPTIGDEAMEVYEITLFGVRTLVSLDSYYIEYAGQAGLRNIPEGGRVIFTKPYRDDTYVISIERNTPITQTADYKKYSEFQMDSVEFVMDKITMILQEIAYRKCNKEGGPYVTTEITQLVDFYPYGPFRASTLDFVINKATTIAAEIKAAKNDCSEDLENT